MLQNKHETKTTKMLIRKQVSEIFLGCTAKLAVRQILLSNGIEHLQAETLASW